MTEIGIGLGSNMGDKAQQILTAVHELKIAGHVFDLSLSSLYRTAPWGNLDQDWFVNACAVAKTDLSAEALLAEVQRIEIKMGRTRVVHWGPRSIDIDILFYGDTRVETPNLTVPHAELLNRAFVLVPLLELKPDLKLGGKPVREALARLDATDILPIAHSAVAKAI